VDEGLSDHQSFIWRAFATSIDGLRMLLVQVEPPTIANPERMRRKSITVTDLFLNL
jgi:hypothetical protein